MSSELSPVFAAELADAVYGLKTRVGQRNFSGKYSKSMAIETSSFISGETGGYLVKKSHVLAVFAAGKGDCKGQAFVMIKGTASLYDALTDVNTGVCSSHTGFPVHQGFYRAFDSILFELRQFMTSLRGVSVIHCVGHSLGGAIATLAADWIKSTYKHAVKLYTFGSPRVGLETFASKCSSRLAAVNSYRVYHKTDPVPMVPTWPFYHVPYTTVGHLIDSPLAIVPWEYHKMEHYIASAQSAGSWKSIASNRPAGHLDSTVERWLKSDGVIVFSANTLDLLNAALVYVIKKVIHVAGIGLVSVAATTLTLLDRMAIFLAKAADVSADLSIWVFRLVKKMASLIGIKIKEGADLTVALVRMVFVRLHRKISEMIWRIGQEIA